MTTQSKSVIAHQRLHLHEIVFSMQMFSEFRGQKETLVTTQTIDDLIPVPTEDLESALIHIVQASPL